MLTVTLKQAGLPADMRKVEDLGAASRTVTEWQGVHGLGASALGEGHGLVRDAGGQRVARVSYNGRVWSSDGRREIA